MSHVYSPTYVQLCVHGTLSGDAKSSATNGAFKKIQVEKGTGQPTPD